jgi:hypothetical protein
MHRNHPVTPDTSRQHSEEAVTGPRGEGHRPIASDPARFSGSLEAVTRGLMEGNFLQLLADARAMGQEEAHALGWADWLSHHAVRWRRARSAGETFVERAVVQAALEAPAGHPAKAQGEAAASADPQPRWVRWAPERIIGQTHYFSDETGGPFRRITLCPLGGVVACNAAGQLVRFSDLGQRIATWHLGLESVSGLAVAQDLAYVTGSSGAVHVVNLSDPETPVATLSFDPAIITVLPAAGLACVLAVDAAGALHRIVGTQVTGSASTGCDPTTASWWSGWQEGRELDQSDIVPVLDPATGAVVVQWDPRASSFIQVDASGPTPRVTPDASEPTRAGEAEGVMGPWQGGLQATVPGAWGALPVACVPSGLDWRTEDGITFGSGGLSQWDASLEGCWPLSAPGRYLLWGNGEVLLFASKAAGDGESGEATLLWRLAMEGPELQVSVSGDRLLISNGTRAVEVSLRDLERLSGEVAAPEVLQGALCCWRSPDGLSALVALRGGELARVSGEGVEKLGGSTFWKGGFAVSGAEVVVWRRNGPERGELLHLKGAGRAQDIATPAPVVAAIPAPGAEAAGSFWVIQADGAILRFDPAADAGEELPSVSQVGRPVQGGFRVAGRLLVVDKEGGLLQHGAEGAWVPVGHRTERRLPAPDLSAIACIGPEEAFLLAPGRDGELVREDLGQGFEAYEWADNNTLCAIRESAPGVLEVVLHLRDAGDGVWRKRALESVEIPDKWRRKLRPGRVSSALRRQDPDGDWCVIWFGAEWVVCWNASTGALFEHGSLVGHETQLPAWFRSRGDALSLGELRLGVGEDGSVAALARADGARAAWQGEAFIRPVALLADGVAVIQHGRDLVVLRPAGTPVVGSPDSASAHGASFRVDYLGAARCA